MGLREKTDFNLQIISLGCAILVILVLSASRHYTSDWRERRLFRRQLAETQQRLASTTQEPRTGSRRRWKRFVAALPLMPLATAYVIVRLGWDVFELLVFCSIDFVRALATRSFVVTRDLVSGLGALGRRIEIGRRLGDAFVMVVERTVVWLFTGLFPRIGDGFSWCGRMAAAFVDWWSDTGGPLAAEYLETVVLQGLVPAFSTTTNALTQIYSRSLWLGARVLTALNVLGSDILHDVLAAGRWVHRGYLWLASDERWWFDPQIKAAALAWLLPVYSGLRSAYIVFAHRFVPWGALCVSRAARVVVFRYLVPLAAWCRESADWGLQAAVGAVVLFVDLLIRGYALFLRSAALLAAVWRQMHVAVVGYVQAAWRFMGIAHRRIVHVWAAIGRFMYSHRWIIIKLADAYSQARKSVLLPAVRLVASASRLAWMKILGPLVSLLHSLAVDWAWPRSRLLAERVWQLVNGSVDWQRIQLTLGMCWLRATASVVFVVEWMSQSAFSAYMSEAAVRLMAGLRYQLNAVLALVWPLVRRGWADAARAMYDVYVQLVSAVDFVVAMVGDFIVDYAQSNVVHRTEAEQSDGLTK
ncbi:hypothetical protein H4R99_003855 [Coemansia sp. RSA 1722]|nr:hypothetical protein IWW45_003788 [Coemansia sp. RSA 485]KAJ2599062.1 hypothetical protein H4R99_003855 [Coemansia sp. RSA 1722]KAJ2637299.1 hypothetical protein GGF40_002452 [Coemansia sp. RSA 1286]